MMARLRAEHRTVYEKKPTPKWTKARTACHGDLELWLKTFLPESFPMAISGDHRAAIRTLQTAIQDGGLFCQAMPRGHGKTTVTQGACLYAVLEGFRMFVVGVGADKAGEVRRPSVGRERVDVQRQSV